MKTNKITRLGLWPLIASFTLLSACSFMQMQNRAQAPHKAIPDNATIKLAEAADSVQRSLVEVARIESETQPQIRRLPNPNTFGIRGSATVDWTGPIGPLVNKLAKASHYRLRTLGKPPAVPIMVNLSANEQPLAEIIRHVDYLAGERANIIVFPQHRIIELRYAKT